MITDLDEQLAKLKEEGEKVRLSKLKERLMSNKLDVSKLSSRESLFVHAFLHSAFNHKCPFTDKKSIQLMHSIVVSKLQKHPIIDKLDKNI